MSYHVFIERTQDPSPGANDIVAKAIANRYGLPFEAITQRMAAGRFRVKSNVDLPTATSFATDLESLGAVCSVVEASAAGAASQSRADRTPVPLGAVPTAPPLQQSRAGMRLPPSESKPVSPALPPAAPVDAQGPGSSALAGARPSQSFKPEESGEYATGLSAAFEGSAEQSDLGMLSDESGSFNLSSLDGKDDPPAPLLAKPAAPVAGDHASEAAAPSNDMVDLFAPPEAGQEFDLTLAMPEKQPRESAAMAAEGGAGGFSASGQPLPDAQAIVGQPAQGKPAPPSGPAMQRAKTAVARDPRLRLLVGVLLALFIGFLPAHVISSIRESSKYAAVDSEVKADFAEYAADQTMESWNDLDAVIEEQRALKLSARDNIALTGTAIWLIGAGAFGFLWMRKLPWERWQ